MAKKKKKKNNNKDKFIIFMTIALVLLLVIWIISDNRKIGNSKRTTQTEEKTTESFNKVTVSDAIELINKDELTFIYIGYEGCSACSSFVPKLSDVAEEYDITVNYLNYKEIDKSSNDWKTFTSKFTKEQIINIQKDDDISTTTKMIGDFLYEDGYTPTFAIFKSGKMIDGNVGGKKRPELRTILNDAGYTKNS